MPWSPAHTCRRDGSPVAPLLADRDLGAEEAERLELLAADDPLARMSPLGRVAIEAELTHALAVRRPAERAPAVTVDAVVIGGLPRTGTTLLLRLLDVMTERRALLGWEAFGPDRSAGGGDETAAVRREARDRVEAVRQIAPKVHAMHALDADRPEECTPLLAHALESIQWGIMAHCPTYVDWLLDAPLDRGYDLWARQLALVAPGAPWLLKCPFHLNDYRALAGRCPTLRLVHIRRDAGATVRSFLNMVVAGRQIFEPDVDPATLGPFWLERLRRLLDRAATDLCGLGTSPVVIEYAELAAAPVATARRLADRLGQAVVHVPARPPLLPGPYDSLPLDAFGLTDGRVARVLDDHVGGPFLAAPTGHR